MPSRVLTVMFTDMKGFTERTSHSSRIELRNMLKEHEELLVPVLKRFGGRVVKTGGDSFMVAFESPTNAVLCGVMMQDRLRARNEGTDERHRLEVRIAISSGEVVEREGDVFGEAVNIAARIEAITEASEIYFTESVYLAMNKAEVPSSEIGMRRLKGVPEAIKVYKVIQDSQSERYVQLIEKLRSGRFEDVPIPTDTRLEPVGRWTPARAAIGGGVVLGVVAVIVAVVALVSAGGARSPDAAAPAPAAPAVPPAPEADRVAADVAAVQEAIGAGELGLARARADELLKNHATRREAHEAARAVVAAEVAALEQKGRIAEAVDLIDERRKEHTYVSFDALERETLLKYVAKASELGNYRMLGYAYRRLNDKYPDDPEILRALVKHGGHGSKIGCTGIGFDAALKLAGASPGPVDEAVARTLVGYMGTYHTGREEAAQARTALARYPSADELVRPLLASEKADERMNAFAFLGGRLSPDEAFAVHLRNLTTLSASSSNERAYLESTMDYFEAASARDDWEARKAAMKVAPFGAVNGLSAHTETTERLSKLLVTAFLPEVRTSLMEWIRDEDAWCRRRAFLMITDAGLTGGIDVWAYHARNMLPGDFVYRYTFFHEAIAYFAAQAKTPRAAEALALLRKAREAASKEYEEDKARMPKDRASNYEFNLKALDDAIAAHAQ